MNKKKTIIMKTKKNFSVIFTISAVSLLTLTACNSGKVEDSYPGQPVKHRQQAFKQILNAFEPLGLMRRNEKKFDATQFRNSLQQLEKYSQDNELLWKYFDKNLVTTNAPSRAKGEIWENFADFEAEVNNYKSSVKNLVTVANENKAANFDDEVIKNAYDEVHQQCRNCHKKFRK